MPISVLMPALSPTMTQGHLVKWHKNIGDTVVPGDLLMDIETDKAVMEVEATQEGTLACIVIEAPAESIPVGHVLALLAKEGEDWQTISCPAQDMPSDPPICSDSPAPTAADGSQRVSPLARKIAKENQLDLSSICGTGPRNRIIKKDVEKALQAFSSGRSPNTLEPFSQPSSVKSTPMACTSDPLPPMSEEKTSQDIVRIPLTPMRKTIAERLSHAKQTIPHFYLSMDCMMDELLAVRQKMNSALGEKFFSVNDFMVRACALALSQTPEFNTQWHGSELIRYTQVDLAVAVSIEGGLITPIIQSAQTLSLKELTKTLHHLIAQARAHQLKPSQYQGGTFTISNLGMWGIDQFYPIINPPQAGILAIGASLTKPVVKNGDIQVAQVLKATLAADHRVVDGQVAAQFLTRFKKLVESPYVLLS